MLPPEEKRTFELACGALGKRVKPAKQEALSSAQMLGRKQRSGESVDDYAQEFERLFDESYGRRADVDVVFRGVLKRDIFVQGLLLKWQEKVLPTTKTFADALHLARTAEGQERQLGELHYRSVHRKKDGSGTEPGSKGVKGDKKLPSAGDQTIPPTSPRDKSKVRCFKCHGMGHVARDCPLRKVH